MTTPDLAIENIHLHSEIVLNDVQLKAIGCVIVEGAELEIAIEQIVIHLVGKHVGGLLLERERTLGAKAKLLREIMLPDMQDGAKQEFESIYSALTTDIDFRNTVAHGDWIEGNIGDLGAFVKQLLAPVYNAKATRNGKSAVNADDVMVLAKRISTYKAKLWWIAASHPAYRGEKVMIRRPNSR